MRSKIKYAFLALALSFVSNISFSADSDLWVAVTIFDGRTAVGSMPEYYGKISKSNFDQLTTAEVKGVRMFELHSVFWLNDEGAPTFMSDTKKHGYSYGYTNDVVFRADHIYRVILVDDKFINKLLSH